MKRLFVIAALVCAGPLSAEVRVSTDFEGGSAKVESVDAGAKVVRFIPGGDPQRGWVCWWHLRLDGVPAGEHWTLDLGGSDRPTRNNGVDTDAPLAATWAQPDSATFSSDGQTWKLTEPGVREGKRIRYEVVGDGGPIRIAWGPPFGSREVESLCSATKQKLPSVEVIELAQSREGRPVRGLHVHESKAEKPLGLWVQARQHAWESGSSWVAHGFTEWVVSDAPEARRLRETTEIFIVPIMDVDRVATGDGGKEANPRDHNRDWTAEPVYPEVAAAQARLLALVKDGRLKLFLDLHNPAPGDKHPFFFVGPEELLSPEGKVKRAQFMEQAFAHLTGPLAAEKRLRTTGASYHPLFRQISGMWVDANGNPDTVAACLETSWNTPHSTTAGYRDVGQKLAQAAAAYLKHR
ncbi:MAG: zinc carboxypeptidase [Verrucomicrobiaceae bacterium]|nr:zinc carboxypeptidase [Verrucomicrobiaceae bacterium]